MNKKNAVKSDAGLQEKLKAAADADAFVAIAKEVGFMISTDELQRARVAGEELRDEELEDVAGGGIDMPHTTCGFNMYMSLLDMAT
jgi:predicted ribosomally synthesized peptide with nif11-like leader